MQLRYISKTKYVLLTTIAALIGLVSPAHVGSARPVSAEPKPCATYEIEGTIEPGLDLMPDSVTGPVTDAGDQVLVREAEVYLHLGDVALERHQVFATFTGALNEMIGDPVLLVTNGEGRASVDVPPGAVNVAFMTESPGSWRWMFPFSQQLMGRSAVAKELLTTTFLTRSSLAMSRPTMRRVILRWPQRRRVLRPNLLTQGPSRRGFWR
jgi:hypothetical protein